MKGLDLSDEFLRSPTMLVSSHFSRACASACEIGATTQQQAKDRRSCCPPIENYLLSLSAIVEVVDSGTEDSLLQALCYRSMSIRGRHVIDRLKRVLAPYIRLPVPPYGQPNYWESSYRTLGPDDTREWAYLDLAKLKEYSYTPVALPDEQRMALGGSTPSTPPPSATGSLTTSLGETLQVYPQASTDEPILIVGCGNSKLGEDMLTAQWRGPILQVDVASRVISALSIRCAAHLPTGDMQIIQDDATLLSALADANVAAVLDKGLLDALFCADEDEQIRDCLVAAHRVLQPGGCLVTLSFSQPAFFLPRLLWTAKGAPKWKRVEIRQLETIFLYRFLKADEEESPRRASSKKSRRR